MRFEFMKAHSEEFPIGKMAEIFKVSRCGYYEFLNRKPSKRASDNEALIVEIKNVHKASRGTYGSPRVQAELKKRGKKCSRKRVAKLMKKEKIEAKMRKRGKVSTQPSNKAVEVAPNHLDQRFAVEAPNKVWISDITYVWTEEGWLYVASVMDLFSRKVIGLSLGDRLETELVTMALKQALYRCCPKKGLLHHSDRGSQYTSAEFKELSRRHGINLSMSAKGHCYDNAVAESFFHTLKTEETHLKRYRTREEAKLSIFEYIEVFYNRERLHSTLGYVSPEDYEKGWKSQRAEGLV